MSRENAVYKKVLRIRQGIFQEIDDLLTVEAPVTIYLNGNELVTLLCTPEKLDFLALGFLRSEGIITDPEDIKDIFVREEGLVEVNLKKDAGLAEKLYGKRTLTSGCGKGTVFFSALDSLRSSPLEGDLTISPKKISFLIDALQDKAELFKATGGVHSAGLADGEKILFFCEDIGRHNAIDKIVGECLRAGISTEDKIMVSSGRLSSEILLKAAKLKIQLLISRAAPTTLCVELADNLNITLVGFARGKRMNVYTHPWRVAES
ncbi:MAG: formate dehydrogenase accessory sulfurtransferase FdhD [Bacillota bacterium]